MADLVSSATMEATLDGVLRKFNPSLTQDVTETIEVRVDVDSSNIPIQVLGLDTSSKAVNSLDDFKFIGIENVGNIAVELMFKVQQYYDAGAGGDAFVPAVNEAQPYIYTSHLIRSGEFMVLPNPRIVAYNEFTSAADSNDVDGDLSSIVTDKDGNASGTDFAGDHGTVCDTDGIVPGSMAIKFYDAGYHEMGVTGVTNDTPSGLTVSTLYDINLAIDGAGATNIAFTTDSSNVNIGGTNGILSKIQTVIDALDAKERKCSIAIVSGDIRVTSNSNLSTSAITITDGTGNTMLNVGIFPAQGSLPAAVPGSGTVFTKGTYPVDDIMYDDGEGNLIRPNGGTGTINYEEGGTGGDAAKYTLTNCPTDGAFKVWCKFDSAHSGENDTTANVANVTPNIYARSMNQEVNATIRLVAFN
jgi:hypothetical protein